MLSPLSRHSSMYMVLVSPHLHRSSFDPSARLPESPVDSGLYCPKGHRLRDRHPYTNSGHHCDECETPLVDGVAGKFCQVVCCATQTVFALSHSMFQPCDYDVCAECIRQMESSPLPKQSPQGNPPIVSSPLLPRQSPQGNLAAVLASAIDASALSPSRHPGRPTLFPAPQVSHEVLFKAAAASQVSHEVLFKAAAASQLSHEVLFKAAAASQLSHEVLFKAAAASPLRPSGRQTGRLRLRVSTPPQLITEVTSLPRLQHRRSVTLSSPGLHAIRLASNLAITTPPRVGFLNFVPCQLFPDSPFPSIHLVHQSVGPDVVAFCDACVQTELQTSPPRHQSVGPDVVAFCDACFQTELQTSTPSSPRLDQPATLRDVRTELRALLIGLGF